MSEQNKAISKIAELRNKSGLTQLQLATLAGVTPNTIQNWEVGKSGIEQIQKYIRLCRALNCNLEDLIDYVSNDNKEDNKTTRRLS